MHEGVVVAAAFEDAGFEAVGAVADFAVRDMFEELKAFGGGRGGIRGGARGGAGPAGPGGEDVLAGTGKADLAGFEFV